MQTAYTCPCHTDGCIHVQTCTHADMRYVHTHAQECTCTHAHTTYMQLMHTCTTHTYSSMHAHMHTCVHTLKPNQVSTGHLFPLPAKITSWPRRTAFRLRNPSPRYSPSTSVPTLLTPVTQGKLCLLFEMQPPQSYPCLSAHTHPSGRTGQLLPPLPKNLHFRAGVQDSVTIGTQPGMPSLGAVGPGPGGLASRSPEGGSQTQLLYLFRTRTVSLLT